MNSDRDARKVEATLYRLEVAGRVPVAWKERFGAHAMRRNGENTVLEIRVRDQSELFGRLRRVHDLNLRLISVALTAAEPEDARARGAAPTDANPSRRGDAHVAR